MTNTQEIPDGAKDKLVKVNTRVIYKRNSESRDWVLDTVVETHEEMECYIIELNEMYDYQRYFINPITIVWETVWHVRW